MFNFLKNQKVRTILFVVFALVALFVFVVFYLILVNKNPKFNIEEESYTNYVDNNYGGGKLTQKVLDLGDMLTGPLITIFDPRLGDIEAPVTIVFFADFECNFCRDQEKILQRIFEKYKDQIKLIWKDYPENDKNSISYKSAVAARCAQEQDSFWEYHDSLFSSDISEESDLIKIAENLDLKINKFEKCLSSPEAQKLVDDNIEEANALDINGVPFVYINSQEIMGQMSYEDFEKIVEIELNN